MHLLPVLATSVLIAGCWSKDAAGPAGPTTAEPRRADACHDEAAKLGQWLEVLESEGHTAVLLPRDLQLVLLAGAPPTQVRYLPAIHVTRTDIRFLSQWVSDVPRMRGLGHLTTMVSQTLAREPGSPVIIAFDESTPWSVVAGVVQAAQIAGVSSFDLLFTAASKLAPPAPAPRSLTREPELFGSCAPAVTLMNKLGETNDDKGRMLIEELPPALEACRCQVDLMALRRWLWDISGRTEPGMPMTTVALAVAPGGAPLTMDPSTPWSAAHAAVVAAARNGKPVLPK